MRNSMNYVKQMAGQRKIGIWGTGKLSAKAEEVLKQLGIDDYVYFDNDADKRKVPFHGKAVLSPDVITKEWYILVSTIYFSEIAVQQRKKGLKDLEDYIDVLELEFYDAWLKFKDEPRVPKVTDTILQELEKKIKDSIPFEVVTWFDEDDFNKFEEKLNFREHYHKGFELVYETEPYIRYKRKIMEYYFTDRVLNFDEWSQEDIYLDLGAQNSPFTRYLRENKHVQAYGIDLEKSIYPDLEYYLQEDATNTHFGAGTVKGVSSHSAFETFIGETDCKVIKEMARILKPGGKLLLIPLYLHERYLSTVSPDFYHRGYADKDSFECIRTDARGGIFGRFYDWEALNKRILSVAEAAGLHIKMYILPDKIVERDAFVYLKFFLELTK